MPQFLTNVIHADATNVALGTTTGTKIGTATSQKLGFYNATPIIQPTGNALTGLSNLGLVATPTLAESDVTNLVTDLAAKSPAATTDCLMPLAQATVAITGGTSLSGTAFGRMHVCSGTSANYTVTLPSPTNNGGKFIGLTMAPGLTKIVTILRNASDLIDGATARLMWANETAILLCDGNNWIKVAGKTLAMTCQMYRSTSTTIPGNGAITKIPLNAIQSDPTGLMGDLTNNRINIARTGSYHLLAGMYLSMNGTGSTTTMLGIIFWSGTLGFYNTVNAATAGSNQTFVVTGMIGTATADTWEIGVLQSSGQAATVLTGATTTYLFAQEAPIW